MGRFLITSALPYINGVKHLGNLAGSMLPADVHARFRRLQGHEVLFVCGTDEHGTPAEIASREAGQDVRSYCDEQHERQDRVCRLFDLSFDVFGRTSSDANRELTQRIASQLADNGFLEVRETKQAFSVDDDRFLPDRYLVGTCPICSSANARGDQCESCGSQLDPADLIAPQSAISGSTRIELRETKHIFLLQSRLEESVAAWVRTRRDWPARTKALAFKYLREGIRDRAITRDLSWGVPVLLNGTVPTGFDRKVFYVWFDAPIGYIGASMEWAQRTGGDWRRWWDLDAGAHDVTYVQFMAKDNVPFHTVNFPATILGSGRSLRLVDRLKAFSWLNYEGGKFSTSERRGIFMDAALELLPADAWRWTLTSLAPESDDTNFSLDLLLNTVNAELANGLGNFATRLTKFASATFHGEIPKNASQGPREVDLAMNAQRILDTATEAHEALEFRAAARATRQLWDLGNKYLTENSPWLETKTNPERSAATTRAALGLLRMAALVAEPIIPTISRRLTFATPDTPRTAAWPSAARDFIAGPLTPKGRVLPVEPPVAKVSVEQIEMWKARFRGR